MSNQGVCIVQEQAINQSGLVDKDCLFKAGYSVRVSGNCLPDLIISRAGTTAAYLLVNSQMLLCGSAIWNRYADFSSATWQAPHSQLFHFKLPALLLRDAQGREIKQDIQAQLFACKRQLL